MRSFIFHIVVFCGSLSNLHCFAYDSLEALRETFDIENSTLITSIGEKFFRHPFESKLHFDLSYYMKDLKAADIVFKAYKNNILPIVIKLSEDGTSNAAHAAFSRALIEVCLLFGNPKHSPEDALTYALQHHGPYGKKWVEEYSKEIHDFVVAANVPLYRLKPRKIEDPFTIVIITTTASGGNFSVAESMAHYLKHQDRILPIIIDVEDIAKEADPVMIATGTYTYDMIYSSIFQKTNDFSVIPGRKKLNREIQQYIPNNLLARLKQKIAGINPDLIISTRSYTSDDIALASFGIPFRMFHPDFELCPSLAAYYRNVPENTKFWLPIFRPSMFKPLFESYCSLDKYNVADSEDILMQKISQILQVPIGALKTQFELIGYPCSNFYKIDDNLDLQRLRKKWDIKEHEIPIFIVMGKHSTGAIKGIFEELLQSAPHLPLKFIFICGKNLNLQIEFQEKIKKTNKQEQFTVHGLLTPPEMNEMMNISHMGISKAGGATVIEAFSTESHLLLMNSYPWEEVNAAFLEEIGLATRFDSKKPLIDQIETCLQKKSSVFKLKEVADWESNLMLHLQELIQSTILEAKIAA
ncbi:Uncharacterized protein PHSC3_000897 [Chlamydiales bacterium STE3]|nr:Uncharacterized protein PHSC3_000897 [Chlamydiales bacterium STE3]